MNRIVYLVLFVIAAAAFTQAAFADKIRLKDKTAVSGDILQDCRKSEIGKQPGKPGCF